VTQPKRVQAVAVDFDGVIHAYSKGWQDGTIYDEPMPGAIDGLRRLQERYAVFVFTSREIEQVLPWLEAQGLDVAADGPPYPTFWNHQDQILVTQRKLPAVAYIDDRAVRFVDWESVPGQLEPGVEEHVIELRENGWTIKHPLSCRPALFDCPVNRAAERDLTDRSVLRGRFWCGLGGDGGLVMGAEIGAGTG
jgi:hypothetical protein